MPTQTKCFERWVGQPVWRLIVPSIGPNANEIIGACKGLVQRIYERAPEYTFKSGLQLHTIEMAHDINWHTCKLQPGRVCEGIFDYGVITPFEMKILVNGGLLSSNHPKGCFDEYQPESLKPQLELYRAILRAPDLSFIIKEHKS